LKLYPREAEPLPSVPGIFGLIAKAENGSRITTTTSSLSVLRVSDLLAKCLRPSQSQGIQGKTGSHVPARRCEVNVQRRLRYPQPSLALFRNNPARPTIATPRMRSAGFAPAIRACMARRDGARSGRTRNNGSGTGPSAFIGAKFFSISIAAFFWKVRDQNQSQTFIVNDPAGL
jgi:hypothetical protein